MHVLVIKLKNLKKKKKNDLSIFDWKFHHLKANIFVFKSVCGNFLIFFRSRKISKFALKNRF